MKNETIAAVIVFFVGLFVYTKFVGPIPFSVNSVTTQKTDFFSVSAEGKSTQVPDVASVTVGVQVQGSTVSQVQQDMNKKINAIADAIKKLGIDAKDIKTANYTVSPMYDYRVTPQRITGYQANTNLAVTIRDIPKANSVVDAATANGANSVSGVSFDISDKTKAQNEARATAVAQAKKNAEDAAKIAGFRLGRLVNYQESFGGQNRPIPMLAKAEGLGAGEPTQVEPGSNEVIVDVTLSYEIL